MADPPPVAEKLRTWFTRLFSYAMAAVSGLWVIPVVRLKQRTLLTTRKRKRLIDIPPCIVPLSVQARSGTERRASAAGWSARSGEDSAGCVRIDTRSRYFSEIRMRKWLSKRSPALHSQSTGTRRR